MKHKSKRKSENAKGKIIIYRELKMQDYFLPTDDQISLIDKKWIFKCRMDDVNIKGNYSWKHEDVSCISCKDINMPETQKHLLECIILLGKNEYLTYIPTYEDLFKTEIHDQAYISMIIREHVKIRELYT